MLYLQSKNTKKKKKLKLTRQKHAMLWFSFRFNKSLQPPQPILNSCIIKLSCDNKLYFSFVCIVSTIIVHTIYYIVHIKFLLYINILLALPLICKSYILEETTSNHLFSKNNTFKIQNFCILILRGLPILRYIFFFNVLIFLKFSFWQI